jgi:formylglycine-generating enzyme required for sulfatase activity
LARTADIKAAVATPTVPKSQVTILPSQNQDIKAVAAKPIVPKSDPAVVIPTTGRILIAPFTEAKAKEIQKSVAKILQKEVEKKVDLSKEVKLDLILIPAGKFMMGPPASEYGRIVNETQHEVTITKPYYMGKYEVTQEQYESVMGNNPSCRTKGSKLPVTDVSWNDCQDFIKKLNAKTGDVYRLPSEAEWEYACRAGTTTAYSFGDEITPKDANYLDSKIGKLVAVWEWCNDWYGSLQDGKVTDPKGPETGTSRVLRGGSIFNFGSEARSSYRNYLTPSTRYSTFGLRLARGLIYNCLATLLLIYF